MLRRRSLLVLLAAGLCLIVAGPAGLGKLTLLAGLDGAAAALLKEPAARGVALYRAGRYEEADAAFEEAGRVSTYNRGLSLATTGRYALSVAYFEAVLFANPADEDASANREIVARLVDPVIGVGDGVGSMAALAGRWRAVEASDGIAGKFVDSDRVRKPLDAGGLVASETWLETLSDAPGEFLKNRLRAEFDRRAAMGVIRPEEAEPW